MGIKLPPHLPPPRSGGIFRGQHRGNIVHKVRPPGARALLRRSFPRQAAGYSPALPIIIAQPRTKTEYGTRLATPESNLPAHQAPPAGWWGAPPRTLSD